MENKTVWADYSDIIHQQGGYISLPHLPSGILHSDYSINMQRISKRCSIGREKEDFINIAKLDEFYKSIAEDIPSLESITALKTVDFRRIGKSQVGLYFLYKDDRIVYVGQSIDIVSRIDTHLLSHRSTKSDVDSFSFIRLPIKDSRVIREIEALYIYIINSARNESIPSYRRFCKIETIVRSIGCSISLIMWYINQVGVRGIEYKHIVIYDSLQFKVLYDVVNHLKTFTPAINITPSKIISAINFIESSNDLRFEEKRDLPF